MYFHADVFQNLLEKALKGVPNNESLYYLMDISWLDVSSGLHSRLVFCATLD